MRCASVQAMGAPPGCWQSAKVFEGLLHPVFPQLLTGSAHRRADRDQLELMRRQIVEQDEHTFRCRCRRHVAPDVVTERCPHVAVVVLANRPWKRYWHQHCSLAKECWLHGPCGSSHPAMPWTRTGTRMASLPSMPLLLTFDTPECRRKSHIEPCRSRDDGCAEPGAEAGR